MRILCRGQEGDVCSIGETGFFYDDNGQRSKYNVILRLDNGELTQLDLVEDDEINVINGADVKPSEFILRIWRMSRNSTFDQVKTLLTEYVMSNFGIANIPGGANDEPAD